MARPALLIAVWVILLAATVALSVLAGQHETLPGDTDIMLWAQERAFPGEGFSDAVRTVTGTEVIVGTGLAVAVALALAGDRRAAIVLAIGIALLPLLQAGVKEWVDRPRPAEPLVELRAGFDSPSFPAGHVMSPTVLYGFVLYLSLRSGLPAALRAAAAAWSAFVLVFAGPPNVWLGVHWPSDILGGHAWGVVLLLPLVIAMEAGRRRT
jgi:undecaprenyl-diphosphatase